MSNQLGAILQQFAAQRRYREQKRNQYLRRFEAIKHNFRVERPAQHNFHHAHHSHHEQIPHEHSHLHQHQSQNRHQHTNLPSYQLGSHNHSSHLHHNHPQAIQRSNNSHVSQPILRGKAEEVPISSQNQLSAEQVGLQRQNQELKQILQKMQAASSQEINAFRSSVQAAKDKYLKEIEKLTENSKKSKDQGTAKMMMLKEQTENALKKNSEIQQVNKNLSKQLEAVNQESKKYIQEIRKEYDQKIGSFEAVFNSSNEKIQALDQGFNEDQFVQNTLKNEELLKSIEQNASKAEEASKILQDYRTLNQGKKQILVELNNNIEMKQREIKKMGELQEKIKVIMDKLNAEKKIYLTENARMAKELGEIKDLLMATINQGK